MTRCCTFKSLCYHTAKKHSWNYVLQRFTTLVWAEPEPNCWTNFEWSQHASAWPKLLLQSITAVSHHSPAFPSDARVLHIWGSSHRRQQRATVLMFVLLVQRWTQWSAFDQWAHAALSYRSVSLAAAQQGRNLLIRGTPIIPILLMCSPTTPWS